MEQAERSIVWAMTLAWTVVLGVAGGMVLHTFEHPGQPRVVSPSMILSAAIQYHALHGSYPRNGTVRAHDGARTAWDEVLLANERCSGGGSFVFAYTEGRLQVSCETDDRVFLDMRPWWR